MMYVNKKKIKPFTLMEFEESGEPSESELRDPILEAVKLEDEQS